MTPIARLRYHREIKRLKMKYPAAQYAWLYCSINAPNSERYRIVLGLVHPTYSGQWLARRNHKLHYKDVLRFTKEAKITHKDLFDSVIKL